MFLPRVQRISFSATGTAQVIAIACELPSDHGWPISDTWSLDRLTDAVNLNGIRMSRSSVARTLHRNALKPHKHKMWLHSRDPRFKEIVNEIVALYL